jgi:hypothetical protein
VTFPPQDSKENKEEFFGFSDLKRAKNATDYEYWTKYRK